MTAEPAVSAEVETEANAAIGADKPILAVQIIRRGTGVDVAAARVWVSARLPGWPPPVEAARPARVRPDAEVVADVQRALDRGAGMVPSEDAAHLLTMLQHLEAERDRLAVQVQQLRESHGQLAALNDEITTSETALREQVQRMRDWADRMEAEAPKPAPGGFFADEVRRVLDGGVS